MAVQQEKLKSLEYMSAFGYFFSLILLIMPFCSGWSAIIFGIPLILLSFIYATSFIFLVVFLPLELKKNKKSINFDINLKSEMSVKDLFMIIGKILYVIEFFAVMIFWLAPNK